MTTTYDILKEYYPDLLNELNQKFPNIVKTSKEIEVIPWQKEFEIADRNPEVIDNIRFLDELLKNNLITEEEYQEEISKFRTYSSKTMGISFIDDMVVSFREKVPTNYILLHEIGHIHFKVNDLPWNSSYGGGEMYVILTLLGKANLTEEQIRKYMKIYEKIYSMQDENEIFKIYNAISDIITRDTDIPEDLISAKLFAGTLINYLDIAKTDKDLEKLGQTLDPIEIYKIIKSGEVNLKPEGLKSIMLMFISAELQDGYRYNDPFYKIYADNFFNNIDEIEI